jgi:hypothetical protein
MEWEMILVAVTWRLRGMKFNLLVKEGIPETS